MDWGMENRLSRILKPADGRTVMLAVDHGYFLGPISKLERPAETIAPLLPYADALMPARGVVRNCVPPSADVPIVLRVSGGNSIVGEDLSKEAVTTSIEDALRLNASAVALSIYVGAKYEHQTLVNLARLVDEGNRYGMPVLAVTAVGKELGKRDARYLALACRIATTSTRSRSAVPSPRSSPAAPSSTPSATSSPSPPMLSPPAPRASTSAATSGRILTQARW